MSATDGARPIGPERERTWPAGHVRIALTGRPTQAPKEGTP